jgi:hypothetical protein
MPNAISVAGPALEPASRSDTVAAGPEPGLPMLKTTPPETGWLSAEITR